MLRSPLGKTVATIVTAVTIISGAGGVLTPQAWCKLPSPPADKSGQPDERILALRQKLQDIKIPKVEFQDATIAQVVLYLKKRSVELDPAGEGVNIMLLTHGAADKAKGADAPKNTVTLSLTNSSIGDVLRLVCRLANLHFEVEANAVIISP